MLEKKINGAVIGRTILGVVSVGVLALPTILNGRENEPNKKAESNQSLVLYDILPSFDDVSLNELRGRKRKYTDPKAINGKEDVTVEERDVNRDGIWDLALYYSPSYHYGRWPVIGLNPKSSIYKPLLLKFGDGIAPSKNAVAFYEK